MNADEQKVQLTDGCPATADHGHAKPKDGVQ